MSKTYEVALPDPNLIDALCTAEDENAECIGARTCLIQAEQLEAGAARLRRLAALITDRTVMMDEQTGDITGADDVLAGLEADGLLESTDWDDDDYDE